MGNSSKMTRPGARALRTSPLSATGLPAGQKKRTNLFTALWQVSAALALAIGAATVKAHCGPVAVEAVRLQNDHSTSRAGGKSDPGTDTGKRTDSDALRKLPANVVQHAASFLPPEGVCHLAAASHHTRDALNRPKATDRPGGLKHAQEEGLLRQEEASARRARAFWDAVMVAGFGASVYLTFSPFFEPGYSFWRGPGA